MEVTDGVGLRERLSNWAGTRPALVVHKAPNLKWATHGVIAGVCSIALVLVLALGTVLAASSGHPASSPTAIASVAFASPSPSPSSSSSSSSEATLTQATTQATFGTTPSPASDTMPPALPTLGPDASFAPVKRSDVVEATLIGPTIAVGCSYSPFSALDALFGHVAVSADGHLLILCDGITVADPSSGAVLKQFTYPYVLAGPIVPDASGGFWVGAYMPDGPDNSYADHYDANGTRLQRVEGELQGALGTTVVIAPFDYDGGPLQLGITFRRMSDGKVIKDYRDPDPYAPEDWVEYRDACGKLVTIRDDSRFDGVDVTLDGWTTASYEPGDFLWATTLGGQCWALFNDDLGGHFARLGRSGIDARSPEFPLAANGLPDVPYSMNGNLWLERTLEGGGKALQVIDTGTWQPTGTAWRLPDGCILLATGSDFWCATGKSVTRLSIPASGSGPAVTAAPGLVPTPESSPTA